jgi:dipeptidyl aminopeptidase/acylaminoacyl peptidase
MRIRRTAPSFRQAVSFLVVLLATGSVAHGARPVTPEDFHTLTWVGDPQWSPADDRIVFVTSRSNEKRDGYDSALWLIEADGSGLRQLTHHPGANTSPRWSPDGRDILFVSARAGAPHAWLLPLAAGGEVRRLTEFELGIEQLGWVPGPPRAISFVVRVPVGWKAGVRQPQEMKKPKDEALERGVRVIRQAIYRAGKSYFEELRPHLFTLDLESGELRQLTAGDVSVNAYSWSGDGSRVAVHLTHLGDTTNVGVGNIQLFTRDSAPGRVLNPAPREFGTVLWRPGDNQILASEESPEGFNAKVVSFDADTATRRELATGFDGDHTLWRWTADGARLFGVTPSRGNVHLWRFDPQSGRGQPITSGRLQLGIHSQMFAAPGFSLSPDGARAVASHTTSTQPEELVVVTLQDGAIRPLTDINADWRAAHSLVPAETFTFKGRDGAELDAWIIPPAGPQSGRRSPMVLQIHGGPRTMYGEHFMLEFQILAGQGHGVLYINPRGSTGYGETSTRATIDNWGGTPYEDLMDGVDAALARYGWIDRERLGVAGGSYGGYMTAWIIGHTERFRAAVAMRGVYNFFSFPLTTDIPHFAEVEFSGSMWKDPQKYWRFSPLAYAGQVKTPTLLIHSEHDFRAPMPDAEQYYAALRLHGVMAEFVRYADEGHELSRAGRPDRRVDRLERIAEWFRRWLDGPGRSD